jgi:hypothetical protein
MTGVVRNVVDFEEDWEAFNTESGIVLVHQDDKALQLIEITCDNEVNLISIKKDGDKLENERAAMMTARIIQEMCDEWGFGDENGDYWSGEENSLLPISLYSDDVANAHALGALVYCWHTKERDHFVVSHEGDHLYRVLFFGRYWEISISEDGHLNTIL